VDDLAGPSGGTATAELGPGTTGVAHTTPTTPPTPVSPSSRARERAGPVRRTLLASTAGGVAGAVIATGALVLTDDSGGGSSSSPRAARQAQATGAAPSAQGDISAILAKDVPAVVAITTDGGPLVDAQGRVVGINTAIANPDTAQNVGFVIPISQAKPIIDRLRGGA
jgi:hypothetical protein